MGLFQRRPETTVPEEILTLLPTYGAAVLSARAAGQPVTDPRFDWGTFLGPVHTPLMSSDREQVIGELHEAAVNADDQALATVGAYSLLAEFNPELDDPRFLALYDDALEHMHTAGFSSGHLTRYEADHWIATRGDLRTSFDEIYEVEVPAADALLDHKPLEPGQSRLIARVGPGENDNRFYVEHRTDDSYLGYSERIWSFDDPTMKRCEEPGLGPFNSLPEVLRATGKMFGTPTHWADDDLEPYFPQRRA